MYSIKIMSSEDMADSCADKGFKMILVEAGDTFEFGHDVYGEPIVTITGFRAGEPTNSTYLLTGNTYVMSETGKTVASFWPRQKDEKVTAYKPVVIDPNLSNGKTGSVIKLTIDGCDPDPEQTVANIQSVLIEARKTAASTSNQ